LKIKFTLVSVLILLISASLFGQKQELRDADLAFEGGQYAAAVDLYRKAYTETKKKAAKAEINYKIAECFRISNNNKQAEIWYLRTIQSGYRDPVAKLQYALALQRNENFEKAKEQFASYMSIRSKDPAGQRGIDECELAIKWMADPERHVINNMAGLNTQFSDFAPMYYKDGLVFASGRVGVTGNKEYKWTGEKFVDIFESYPDETGKWSFPYPVKGTINTPLNDATCTFYPNGRKMIYTHCFGDKEVDNVCKLYKTELTAEGWTEQELLPFGNDSVTVGNPSLNADGTKLFFVSNQKGGFGGRDIYVSYYDEATQSWDEPANLGENVNTAGDEMFPYIHTDGKTLFFSSNGHLGMGGMDNFKSTFDGIEWSKAENLKFPLNSGADDFSLILDTTKQSGYFASNRDGGKGNDDLYYYYLPALYFSISGVAKDDSSGKPLANVVISLSGSDSSLVALTTDTTGKYKFELKANTSYTVSVRRDDYFGVSATETTIGLRTTADKIVRDFALKPMPKEGVEIVLPNILYDLNSAALRDTSKASLDDLIKILKDNPTLVIAINAHTDCRASKAYNQDLSQRRAQSVVDYLVENEIDVDRLVAKGYGESKLLNDCECEGNYVKRDCSDDEHQANRRTAFEILATDYSPKKDN